MAAANIKPIAQCDVKSLLDKEVQKRNCCSELSYANPDPLLVASRYKDESIALICALFAYGNARNIVAFLDRLDFSLLQEKEEKIKSMLEKHYYRFQTDEDVTALLIALKRLKQIDTLENLFYEGYKKEENLLEGLWHFIGKLKTVHPYKSCGYDFLTGRIPRSLNQAGTYKRYLMFLRWMVRKDALDMGLWQKIDKKDLLIPLDTHTFHVSRKLGLLQRKSYDMKAVLELTDMLKKFDSQDPVKYDFALYRLGQEKRV